MLLTSKLVRTSIHPNN